MAARYVAAPAPVPVYSPDVVTAVASFDHAVKLPVYAPHGVLYSLTHRPQRTCFIGNPASQLLLGGWMEGWLKQRGLLEELLNSILGVVLVSCGTRRDEADRPVRCQTTPNDSSTTHHVNSTYGAIQSVSVSSSVVVGCPGVGDEEAGVHRLLC
jgi:hypothetical protein